MRRWLLIALILTMAAVLYGGSQDAFKTSKASKVWALNKQGVPVSVASAADPDAQLPPAGSRNPRTGDEVIISEGFEAVADNALPAGWVQVDVDNGTCPAGDFTFPGEFSRWRVRGMTGIPAHGGTKVCLNNYNGGTPVVANNDWLILPQQNLTGEISFSYWIASQDDDYLESYEIRVSTTGTLPANFTNLIYSETNTPTTYTQHTHNLSAYSGAPFYIAFHHNASDKFVIKIDDVLLERTEAVPRGAIGGVVTDVANGSPLQNVTVSIVGTMLTATTNASGEYYITNIPADTHTVQFTRNSYFPTEVTNVIVIANDTVTVNAAMARSNNVIEEDFEAVTPETLPAGWMQVDVDQGTSQQTGWVGPTVWRVRAVTAHSGTKVCANVYNSTGGANNDWLILPQQNLTGTITLSYWISSQLAPYLEEYEVRVSTTGTLPANFTNLIYSGANIPVSFEQHTHDLSAYAGAPFYVAFHHISNDEFIIKLDDVVLAGSPQTTGVVRGVVTNSLTSAPLQDVAVAILGTQLTATTNAAGLYTILAVPPDTYDVRFVKADFDTLVMEGIIVAANDTLDLDVSLDPADAADDFVQSPQEFAFYGNYPNPFNARTEFRFAVNRAGMVELTLYNIVGQEVARVVRETMNAGVHSVAFDAGSLPSGLYLARLSAAGQTVVHKTMLLK